MECLKEGRSHPSPDDLLKATAARNGVYPLRALCLLNVSNADQRIALYEAAIRHN
jgi:hypothetical protein